MLRGFPVFSVVLPDAEIRSSPLSLAAWLNKMWKDGYEFIGALGELCVFRWRIE